VLTRMTRLFKPTRAVRRATQLEVILHTWKHVSGQFSLLAWPHIHHDCITHLCSYLGVCWCCLLCVPDMPQKSSLLCPAS
jgi:hypothetical protein